tara:strand:- start:1316 stop:1624 length:309 start_codon:yes stop_codon:yes gene_type:complete
MKKFFVIFLVISLILSTAVIKNSTKRIDDDIFTVKENLRDLKKNYDILKLEHDYLSSADKLLEYQNLYFENELIKKDIQNIYIIYKQKNILTFKTFELTNEK